MLFIAFLKKKNFPEAIIFYSAHGHIQYHEHRVHLGKAKARIHVKKKKNHAFCPVLQLTLQAICNWDFVKNPEALFRSKMESVLLFFSSHRTFSFSAAKANTSINKE